MSRYLIEVVSVATDINPNFAGNKVFTLYTKGEVGVKHWGDTPGSKYDYTTFMTTEDYFTTKAAATRALNAYKEAYCDTLGYWISTARVIDFDNYQTSEASTIAEKLYDDYYANDTVEVY